MLHVVNILFSNVLFKIHTGKRFITIIFIMQQVRDTLDSSDSV